MKIKIFWSITPCRLVSCSPNAMYRLT